MTIAIRTISLILLIAGLLGTPAVAHSQQLPARNVYVAPDGSDSNPGSLSRPFLTVGTGLSMMRPGDTLYLRAGTYAEGLDSSRLASAGTSFSTPVTIQAYERERVTLQPRSGVAVVSLGRDIQYTIWKDLVLDAVNVQFGVHLTNGAHHNRFQNIEVKYAKLSGIVVYEGTGGTDFNEFIDCKSHNNGTSVLHHGITLATSDNLVEGGEFYNNLGFGIQLSNDSLGADRNIIRKVRSYNNGMFGIAVTSGTANLAYANLIYDNGRGGIEVNWGRGTINTKLYNNTIYRNKGAGIAVGSNNTTAAVSNNLLFLNSSGIVDYGSNGTVQSNNLDNSKFDPKFVDATTLNFTLQAGSPAIDTGSTIPDAPIDMNGILRPQGLRFDIGAYEYEGSSVTH